MVNQRKRAPNLRLAGFVVGKRPRRYQQVVNGVRLGRRGIGKVLLHGAERNVNLGNVHAIIAVVLFLVFHHADHGVGNVVQEDGSAHCLS